MWAGGVFVGSHLTGGWHRKHVNLGRQHTIGDSNNDSYDKMAGSSGAHTAADTKAYKTPANRHVVPAQASAPAPAAVPLPSATARSSAVATTSGCSAWG